MSSQHDIATLCDRFLGVDISCRRVTNSTDWPMPWRARLVTSKNERSSYRITTWGQNQIEAENSLVAAVAAVDEES